VSSKANLVGAKLAHKQTSGTPKQKRSNSPSRSRSQKRTMRRTEMNVEKDRPAELNIRISNGQTKANYVDTSPNKVIIKTEDD